jgi:hypothetical protein
LDDVALSAAGDTTVLQRAGTDRAALLGLLGRIQDLGLDISTFTRNRQNRHAAPGDPSPLPDGTPERCADDASGEVRRHDGQ